MAFIFGMAAVFWATELLPLHATAVLVVLLEILLLGRWTSAGAGLPYERFLAPLASPVIILFLGGFVMATALRKYGIDQRLASRLIALFGRSPLRLMTGFMATTAFFALWMSGTATSAMMLAMISPLLAQLEADDPFRKALVLSVPFGARVGSIGTPVGTPPNAIAVGILQERGLEISFAGWMTMGLPLAVVVFGLSGAMLFLTFRPRHPRASFTAPPARPVDARGAATIAVAVSMAALWLTSTLHGIPDGIVALMGLTCFLGFGLLDRDDLKKIDWDILILMWGGLALGEGIQLTGLADQLVGLPLFAGAERHALLVFCALAMLISTFMSNTTSANLLLPLVAGFSPESPLLPIAVALACSFDIPLPISSPPNALAYATKEVTTWDLLKAGTPVALAAVALVVVYLPDLIRLAFP